MGRADDGKTGAHVAAGQLHDGLAGPQITALFGVEDDLQRRPVFLRVPGVEHLELGQNPALHPGGDAVQRNQRCAADGAGG